MRHLALLVIAALSCADGATAQNLVPLPPHALVYNGFSRGYRFTARTNFVITALSLPADAKQPGDLAAFLVLVDGVQVLHSTGNVGGIPASLLVQPGQEVDVLGNWSPATPTNFSAHNSLGIAPFTTTIEGVPHALTRAGWQWDIGDPSFGGTQLAPSAVGSIGRVVMTTSPPTGYATRQPFGEGCYELPRMVHERFGSAASAVDLSNTQWRLDFVADANGGHYVVSPGGPAFDRIGAAQNGIDLAQQPFSVSYVGSWNDASVVRTLPTSRFPNGLPFPNASGASASQLTINSNGRVHLGGTQWADWGSLGAPYTSLQAFTGQTGSGLPMLAAWFCDLDPTAGGHVWYEVASPGGGVRVTWDAVPNFQDPSGPPAVANDVQIELLPNGRVHLAYGPSLGTGGVAGNDAIVGFSAGAGEPTAAPVDWSTLSGHATGDGSTPPTLDADARPLLGTTVTITLAGIPQQSPLAAIALGAGVLTPSQPLGSVGMPGCLLHVPPDVMFATAAPTGTASVALPIPSLPALAGAIVGAQGIVLDATVRNPLGGTVSNGLALRLDGQ